MSDRNYWLMKSEPDDYSIDDLKKDGETEWTGVRNYAARNYMRDDMKKGDGVLFYHSNISTPVIVGTMEVSKESHPDPLQFDPNSKYFDEKSTESEPRWQLVDVKFVQKFDKEVTRDQLKEDPVLQDMELFRLARHSITPVREEEWKRLHELAEAEAR